MENKDILPTREWLQQNAILYASHDDGYAWGERYFTEDKDRKGVENIYAVVGAQNDVGYIVKQLQRKTNDNEIHSAQMQCSKLDKGILL